MLNFLRQKEQPQQPLKGSYDENDCLFLLKPIKTEYRSIKNKEELIQSGQLHYSEMIHKEVAPTQKYTDLFLNMTEKYKNKLAAEVMLLAQLICEQRDGPITILSLARAGTPIGVLLQRALTKHFDRESTHYSISIVRDRGIDKNALDYVIANDHKPESIVFVDGWTAKGVIGNELRKAVDEYNEEKSVNISNQLFVISDIGGTSDVQSTFDDYTIPSALMNSTVSGLISRSILNEEIQENDFHGCVSYEHLKEYDLSNWFVDTISKEMNIENIAIESKETKEDRKKETENFLSLIMSKYNVSDINRIKPGIAEATRVLLRRVPDLLLVKDISDDNISHLKRLAYEKEISIIQIKEMPFGACALIKDILKSENNERK